MRIGIDGACWLNRRGYGRFTRELLAALVRLDGAVDYTLLVDFDPAEAPPIPPGVRVERIWTRHAAARSAAASSRRSLRDLWTASRAFTRGRFDIVFFPSEYTYVPVAGRSRIAVVIHDVIAEQFPEHVFPTRRAALFWRLKSLAARKQADLMMTVSETSRQAIAARFAIPAERIVVVPEAADARFRPLPRDQRMRQVLERWGLLDQRFIFYVGGISPHKNLGALVAAFAELRRSPEYGSYRLVLAGDHTGDVFYSCYDQLRAQAVALAVADSVTFTGYVPDEDLAALYSAADAFVLPSLDEGFGLPVVEALACGAPVLASARGSLPEIVGDAGLLFDPERRDDLVGGLRRLLSEPELSRRLRQRGPARAAEFSWERGARTALGAFRTLASGVATATAARAVRNGAQP